MIKKFKSTSLLNAYAHQVDSAFQEIGRPISNSECETLSFFLLRTMGSESRDYHRPEHSLDVSKKLSPIGRLAALFHDIVYVQVDPSWERSLNEILYPFVPSRVFSLDVRGALNHVVDPWFNIVVKIFGFENETNLIPSRGLNEFLSAIVFYQKMRTFLKPEELLCGIACIEATIPFRKTDSDGNTPGDRLRSRVEAIKKGPEARYFTQKFDFEQTLLECKTIIENDLASFSKELSGFLSNTWSVMIENNPSLRNRYYLISEYRKAIFSNIGFYSSLDVRNLYWTSATDASNSDKELLERTSNNLRIATEYMKAIAISVSMVEAIAILTGGDTSFELFFGSAKKSREHFPINLDSLIQFTNTQPQFSEERSLVYNILRSGRSERSRFDHKKSVLSAYLYERYTQAEFTELFKTIQLFHQEKVQPIDCLSSFYSHDVEYVIGLLENTAQTRKNELRKLKASFSNPILKAA